MACAWYSLPLPSAAPSPIPATSASRSPRPSATSRSYLRDRHRDHQVPLPGRHRVDQLIQAKSPRRAKHGGDVAVRQAAGDLERPVEGGRGRRLALQHPGQRVELGLGPGTDSPCRWEAARASRPPVKAAN